MLTRMAIKRKTKNSTFISQSKNELKINEFSLIFILDIKGKEGQGHKIVYCFLLYLNNYYDGKRHKIIGIFMEYLIYCWVYGNF